VLALASEEPLCTVAAPPLAALMLAVAPAAEAPPVPLLPPTAGASVPEDALQPSVTAKSKLVPNASRSSMATFSF
jgi:hypothetical protein